MRLVAVIASSHHLYGLLMLSLDDGSIRSTHDGQKSMPPNGKSARPS
ncbi:hypothetical protein ATPR_2112 [Acetobacter tropicalis NBRC 101654]|uniref:Uncharacterized protein n=1 Tax=Acetobacter tropicalis NBRC 101654 TaxID=749388 RepID=F7VFG3_9PROT|nr:hypothetical protein ATPR_2112 [Acetobacter tropicalis NBRC 101654]